VAEAILSICSSSIRILCSPRDAISHLVLAPGVPLVCALQCQLLNEFLEAAGSHAFMTSYYVPVPKK
jgi:hypothetical protein